MANIFILIQPDCSHFTASFHIARQLSEAGHHISYLCFDIDRDYVQNNGFETSPLMAQTHPERPPQIKNSFNIFAQRRAASQHFEEIEADFENIIKTEKPDLFLIDTMAPFYALFAMKHHIPVIMLNTYLYATRQPNIPPLWTPWLPAENDKDRKRNHKAWKGFMRIKGLRERLLGYKKHHLRLAADAGLSYDELNHQTYFMFELPAPQIILAPRALEFEPDANTQATYAGLCVDYDRQDVDFSWDRLHPDKDLVYASFGSTMGILNPKMATHVFESIISAVGEMEDKQLVLVTTKQHYDGPLAERYDNVTIVNRAPQIAILKRASVMITHAGVNSVKECIGLGVPMILYPIGGLDRPGNAARVAFHNAGLVGDHKRITTRQVSDLVRRITDDPAFRQGIAALRQRCLQEENPHIVPRLAEQTLASHSESGKRQSQHSVPSHAATG